MAISDILFFIYNHALGFTKVYKCTIFNEIHVEKLPMTQTCPHVFTNFCCLRFTPELIQKVLEKSPLTKPKGNTKDMHALEEYLERNQNTQGWMGQPKGMLAFINTNKNMVFYEYLKFHKIMKKLGRKYDL